MSVSKDKDKIEEPKVDDNAGIKMSGHILIRDAETKEEIVNKRNAILNPIVVSNMSEVCARSASPFHIWCSSDVSILHSY